MPKITPLDLMLTPEARAGFVEYLGRITEFTPTLVLLKTSINGASEEHWMYSAYAPANIAVVATELESLGQSLLYSFCGLVVAIPQFHLLPELSGSTLAVSAEGLVVQPSGVGI